MSEFYELWNSKYALDYEDFIENYQTNYNIIKEQRRIAKEAEIPSLEAYKLQPNSMLCLCFCNERNGISKNSFPRSWKSNCKAGVRVFP